MSEAGRDWRGLAQAALAERAAKSALGPSVPVVFSADSAGSPDPADPAALDEREAMALEGGVPPAFARAFAALQFEAPEGVSLARHEEMMDDAGRLLDAWGEEAERLGWSAADLIGPDPSPEPLAWALKGATIARIHRNGATLSDGRKYRRVSTD